MAKLITHHDPFHAHKILGLLVLLNMAYRLALYLWRGYAFCQADMKQCSQRDGYDREAGWYPGLGEGALAA